MSTPSAKTLPTGGKGKTTTTTTTVVKTTTTTTKQPQQKLVSTLGAGSKVKKAKTTATGKKVVNAHSNRLLSTNGLMRFSRGRMYHRRALYRINKWRDDQSKLQGDKTKKTAGSIQKKKRTPALKKKPVGGERNGKERLVRAKRFPRYYPTEERPKKFSVKRKTFSSHPRRFRSTLTPGTVVILVAGKHAGKRAVVVKHLSSGLLLVTGPHKLNGVSLRRVNQIYVIATSTKLDLSSATFDSYDDKFFKRVRPAKKNAEKDIFDDKKKEKPQLTEERRQAQRTVDTAVLSAIKSHADSRLLRRYIKSRFQLWNGVLPHKLQF